LLLFFGDDKFEVALRTISTIQPEQIESIWQRANLQLGLTAVVKNNRTGL